MPLPVAQISDCRGCPLREMFPSNNFVPPKAGASNRCAIGEAPGQDESIQGEPFVGKSGRWLDSWFAKVGVMRRDLWMTNVLSCRPKNNWFPTDPKARSYIPITDANQAVRHCLNHHLLPFLQGKEWEKIYLIGGKALKYLAEKDSLFDWGGTPLPIPALNPTRRVAVATIHPAALMREPEMLPFVYCDLKRPLEIPPEHYVIYPAPEGLRRYFGGPFCLDIETNVPPTEIRMFSASNVPTEGTVVRFDGQYVQMIAELIAQAPELVGHNLIDFDLPHLAAHGAPYDTNPDECIVWDTMLMHHLVWPTLPHDLGSVARQYLTKPFWKKWKAADAPDGAEEAYACRDADGTWQIYVILRRELQRNPKLLSLYHNVQVPLARICHLMTDIGIMTDPDEARKMAAKADQIISEQERLLPEHMRSPLLKKRKRVAAPAGMMTPPKYGKRGQLLKAKPVKWLYEELEVLGAAPWRNGPRTAQFLYEELGLKEMTDAAGKVTTGKKALAIALAKAPEEHRPAVKAITNARRWAHRKTICAKLTQGAAKRIHASFNVHGTSTGRLSSSGGDDKIQLQNITEEMRVLFVPSRPGWKLIAIDFSQMEARLAAWFANDTERAARFDIPGFNEYKLAASIFLGVPVDKVEKDKSPDSPYHRAKTIVLGTDRALGSRKISTTEDIPESEVKQMQRQWKAMIPKTIEWQERVGNLAKRQKYLDNPFGRRCLFYGDKEYTEGISFLPQSTGADVIFRSMISLMFERIEWPRSRVEKVVRVIRPLPEPARLILQIHDELVFEAPAEAVDDVVGTACEVMTQPWPELNELALPANPSVGDNWLEMEDV